MLFSKEPRRLRDLYFADMSAFCLPNMRSCALSLPTNHHLLCISKSSQLLFPFRDLIKVQACPPPTLPKARAGPTMLRHTTNHPPYLGFLTSFILSWLNVIYLMVILPVLVPNCGVANVLWVARYTLHCNVLYIFSILWT